MGEWRYSSTVLDLGIRWGLVVSFTPLPLYPGKIAPCTDWIRGWVVSSADLDAVEQRKLSCSSLESNPGHPARSPSLFSLSYTDFWLRK
jgi:hypothetical protein